jgi:hypothetical protein
MWSSPRSRVKLARRLTPILVCAVLMSLAATPVEAHETRQVGNYTVSVGLIDEPVYVGQRSGLDLQVSLAGAPVTGLERTLKAQVDYGSSSLPLTLEPALDGGTGYTATFIPTAAGKYTFRLTGTIEETTVNESFTSSPTGFDEVQEAASGQFPIPLPTVTELAAEAKRGSDAAALVPAALGVGVAGIVVGLLGLGVGLAGRRRTNTES